MVIRKPRGIALFPLLALLVSVSCDQSFEPIQQSNNFFSIQGVLDAAADTQWIRVMPVRDSVFSGPGPIDAVVTLENLGTGKKVVLTDVPTRYVSHDPNVIGDLYAHNFVVTEKIEYGATYRLTVTRSDGASTSAVATIPQDVPAVTVAIVQPPHQIYDYVRIDNSPHIAMVQLVGREQSGVTKIVYQGMGNRNTSTRRWEYRYLKRDDIPGVACPSNRCDLAIVTTAEPWPFEPFRQPSELKDINVNLNVVNGVGFLGGIATKTVPYDDCRRKVPPPATPIVYCLVTYGGESASIAGWVRDFHCGSKPVLAGATIFLTEIEGEHIRSTSTVSTGQYAMGALIPGMRYAYRVSSSVFEDLEGTLVFGPRENLELDFLLRRKTNNCPDL